MGAGNYIYVRAMGWRHIWRHPPLRDVHTLPRVMYTLPCVMYALPCVMYVPTIPVTT
jgi:hypothetical protein